MKYIFLSLFIFLFLGCSTKEASVNKSSIVVEDLVNVPQNVEYYTKNIKDTKLYDVQNNFQAHYFKMWNIKKAPQTLEDVKWFFRVYKEEKSYGENLVLVKKDFFEKMYEKSNFDKYNTVNKKAIVLKYSNIRALPTDRPILKDPTLAGEGFPFDYVQNSSIHANTPVFVSHYSKNKQWAFVFSSFTYGWLKISEIVLIEDENTDLLKNMKQVYITKEGTPLFTTEGEPLFDTKIGMIFPLIEEDDKTFTVLTVLSFMNNKPIFNKTILSKDIASKNVLKLNSENINKIIKEVSKTNYGWGGLYGQRDCSSTLMDLFTPFGIYLPRNSSQQAKIGEVIDLSYLNNDKKTEFIREKATPFQTLLYKSGHIVLYVGMHNDEVIVFQNLWGIKTKLNNKEGRFIIGRTVFSTLKIGDELENYDKNGELLKNIKSMNTITK